jgi:hypothetical protein
MIDDDTNDQTIIIIVKIMSSTRRFQMSTILLLVIFVRLTIPHFRNNNLSLLRLITETFDNFLVILFMFF